MIRANRGTASVQIHPHDVMYIRSDSKQVMMGVFGKSVELFAMRVQFDPEFRQSAAGVAELLEKYGINFIWLDRGLAVNADYIAHHRIISRNPHIKAICVLRNGQEFAISRYKTPNFLAHMAQKAAA